MAIVKLAVYYCIEIIELFIIIRCIISWFPIRENKFTELLYAVTDPILSPVRRLMSNFMGDGMMMDFSPIIAFLILSLIQRIVFAL